MTSVPASDVSRSAILLHSGRYFDLESPETSSFTIDDIAHALSHLCRYAGHCDAFYSVAQHSVLVSHSVPMQDALAGLLHDAAEAFLGDVASPLKRLLPDYQALERRVEQVVFRRFGLPDPLPPTVKHADLVLLRTEQRDLMDADSHVWPVTQGVKPLAAPIVPWSPRESKRVFLKRFQILIRLRNQPGHA